jgi:hypothetical protein
VSEFRLLFDEDVPVALILAVVRRHPGIEQLRIGAPGAPPFSSADAAILRWCEREGRQLVSLDRSTMPEAFAEHLLAGHHSPGVFIIRRRAELIRVIDDMLVVLGASDPAEWYDRVVTLPW